MLPFKVSLGYQPLLFPSTENKLAVPSLQHHLKCRQRIWTQTKEDMLRTTVQNKRYANCHRSPAPDCSPGQKLWLAAKDIPLKSLTQKLAPHYIEPYEIDAVLSPMAGKLKLPLTCASIPRSMSPRLGLCTQDCCFAA